MDINSTPAASAPTMLASEIRRARKTCGPACCLTIETTVYRIRRDGSNPLNHIEVPAPEAVKDMSAWF